jgi:uncharacterized Ntn-hydrolase superfamily protein
MLKELSLWVLLDSNETKGCVMMNSSILSYNERKFMKTIATFSIVARDPLTGEIGIAVSSKFLAVGSAVPWARANVGAIATQALANLDFGPVGLDLLQKGYSAQKACDSLKARDPHIEDRQFGIVDSKGGSATFTGKNCFDYAGGIAEENLACQGNILVGRDTVTALAKTFKATPGSLAVRLVKALEAAQEVGGDKRGRQSAALLVVKPNGGYGGYNDRYIDLRVDDDPQPIKKLIALLHLHQMYFNKTDEADKQLVDEKIALKIQEALKICGYYKGPLNGQYNEPTKKAFSDFCGWENFEERINEGNIVDKNVLDYLLKKAKASTK